MSIFESDYEAHGSVMTSQLSEQRSHGDSYFGDLLLMHSMNGKNTADDIRYEWMHGVTAQWRKYLRVADKHGFNIAIEATSGSTSKLSIVKQDYPNAIGIVGNWGMVTGYSQALAEASLSKYSYRKGTKGGHYYWREASNPLDQPGWVTIPEPTVGPNNTLMLGALDTGIKANNPSKEGYFGYVKLDTYNGAEAEMMPAFFSDNPGMKDIFIQGKKTEGYPSISLKDNWNNEQPYFNLPDTDPRYIAREKVLNVFGIDFYDISKDVFNPDPIPAFGSQEWNEGYGKEYKQSADLQARYGSESAYRQHLVEDQQSMKESIKYYSDVHMGPFISPKTLDYANVIAAYWNFRDIIPGIPGPLQSMPDGDFSLENVNLDITSGSLKMSHKIMRVNYGKRRGDITTYNPRMETRPPTLPDEYEHYTGEPYDLDKYQKVDMTTLPRNKGRWGTLSTGKPVIYGEPEECGLFEMLHYDPYCDYSGGFGGIFIAVPATMDDGHTVAYKYIEILGPTCKHHIDVYTDPDHGTHQELDVSGSLKRLGEADYSDVILYPMTKDTMKKTPLFKRERLLRETMMLVISGIQVTEIKWYQKGFFQLIIMVTGAIVGCLIALCAPVMGLIAGEAAAWGALTQFVMQSLLVSIASMMLFKIVDSPILAALLVVIAPMLLSQTFSINLLKIANMAVEATNTYLKKKFTQEAIAIQERVEELQEQYNKKIKEMKDLEKEAGMHTDVIKNYSLNSMLIPSPGETPEDFFERTLRRDLAIIELRPDLDKLRTSHLPDERYS